ncbi:6741_t:CDS:2, partial [Gigaspora rosea]
SSTRSEREKEGQNNKDHGIITKKSHKEALDENNHVDEIIDEAMIDTTQEPTPRDLSLADQFLQKQGIKKDKDGTPNLLGTVMGNHGKAQLRHAVINKLMNVLSDYRVEKGDYNKNIREAFFLVFLKSI